MIWHTEMERELIRQFGGTPLKQFGVDGRIDGRPVEVRVNREDDRFRLQKDVHEDLMAGHGSYIFDSVGDGKPPKQVPAREVNGMLGPNWYEDRDYPHQFVDNEQIFGGDSDDDRPRDPLFGLPI